MGRGYLWRPAYRDKKTGEKKRSSIYWIGYSVNGTKQRESTGTTSKRRAEEILNRRLADIHHGAPLPSDLADVTFEDLADILREDYKRNGRRSRVRTGALSAFFAGFPASAITERAIERYVGHRLDQGMAPATVNRELAALRRMFRLGARQRLVARVPQFAMLKERNVRKGFVGDMDLVLLLNALPPSIRPLVEVAYVSGWRRGEILSRNWRHVDIRGRDRWMRLEPGETKSGEGRQFPITARLREIFEGQRKVIEEYWWDGGPDDPVFFWHTGRHRGTRIRRFDAIWREATKAAGVEGLLFHDLRRSAARNMIASGIDQHTAMKLTGHRTSHIFRRYAIVDALSLRAAGERLEERELSGDRQGGGKV